MSKWAVVMTDGKEVYVAAEMMRIEANGALIFYRAVDASFADEIVRAIAAGSWKTTEKIE